jgi:hypothetical protein
MKRALMIAMALFALAACDDKKTETKPEDPASKNATTTGATTAAATATTATPAAVTIDDGVLSTPADFEETAEKAITKANYKKELSSLETDIAKE